jgi:uncharacterized protein YqjF (DUF2071 family)
VQDGLEEKALRQRHSIGTGYRPTLMPTYLKMTFLPRVTMTLQRTTGNIQAADTGLTLPSAHVIMHLQNKPILIYYCSDRSLPKETLVHIRTILYGFLGKTQWNKTDFHTLRFLHFSDNRDKPDTTDETYDKLWKIITISDKLNDAYVKCCSTTEHYALDEINVLSFSDSTYRRNIYGLG